MTLPTDAVLEAEVAGGIALYDVSHLLPTHPVERYQYRDPRRITTVFTHHSGAMGPPGFRGALGSARYVVEGRGWAGAAYHYWLSHKADRDAEGRIVVYRLQPDEARSSHTGGVCNGLGVGVCWQGDLGAALPSSDQIEMAEALYPWLEERHGIMRPQGFGLHNEARGYGAPKSKPSCPGPHVSAWVRRWRGEAAA